MAFYNPNAETHLIVDAGPTGLGAILSQEQEDGTFHPVSYGSRSLSDVETRYSQTEKEALAVLWACQHYHHYVYDRHITIISDHKPLERMLTTNSNPPPRIQRWLLRLQAYNYIIFYQPGKDNAADILSQSPLPSTYHDRATEEHINMIVNHATPKAMKLSEIVESTSRDETLQEVIQCVKSSRWKKSPEIIPYFLLRNEISVSSGLLLKFNCIIIPKDLRERVIGIAHSQHQGIGKTKPLLREKVWWPNLSKSVEEHITNCLQCQTTTPSTVKCEPLKMSEIPKSPWHTRTIAMRNKSTCHNRLSFTISSSCVIKINYSREYNKCTRENVQHVWIPTINHN